MFVLASTFMEYIVKLKEPRTIISLIAVLLLTIILFAISSKKVMNTRLLAYGALSISAAFILSYVRIYKLPYGGTVTLASMLPIFIFAYIAGPRAGMIAGLCYGLLQAIQDPYIVHWAQFLLDYPIAFAFLGLAGLNKKNIYIGAILGSFARLVCHFLSGVVFFASYAGDQNVFQYSFIYNVTYMLPDTIICLAIVAIPGVMSAIQRVRTGHLA